MRDPTELLGPQVDINQWLAEQPTVGEWARKFYREYVGIADEEELKDHLIEVRALAWNVYKYRCVASFLFVNYNLGESYGREWYEDIIQRVKRGDKFVDLACAFGHTARNLVYDGAPQENVISGDLRQEFWELGYQLFRDREKFHGVFHQGDIFDSNYLQEYNGKIDIVHMSSFFHLFEARRSAEGNSAIVAACLNETRDDYFRTFGWEYYSVRLQTSISNGSSSLSTQ